MQFEILFLFILVFASQPNFPFTFLVQNRIALNLPKNITVVTQTMIVILKEEEDHVKHVMVNVPMTVDLELDEEKKLRKVVEEDIIGDLIKMRLRVVRVNLMRMN